MIRLWQLSLFLDVDGALEEIAYALDTLKLDGVVMLTNSNGVYLGDKRLDPVFDELNRRGTVSLFILHRRYAGSRARSDIRVQ